MTDAEWTVYDKMYRLMVDNLPTPNLMIYLEKTVDELLRNIAKRGRDFEKIPREYLESLDKRYKNFYANWHFPKIKITTDIYENKDVIIQKIQNALYHSVYE